MTISRVFYADDIGCEHCARTIETALAQLDGVAAVHVAVSDKAIELELRDGAVEEQAIALLDEIGYPVRA